MLIRSAEKIRSSEITPKEVYLKRRELLAGAGALAIAGGLGGTPATASALSFDADPNPKGLKPTAHDLITSYNNFYEFGVDKSDPAKYAGALTTEPWTIEIDGLCQNPGTYDLEKLIPTKLEERIYRFRCVEAWSMVVPWIGFPLKALIDQAEPLGSAKYVAFETLVRPEEMRGQNTVFQLMDWPYREGLRLDEAMHPLTIMANGLYGEEIPNQNGAPLRLVVPWKYGFKSIKTIVKISFTEEQPFTSWNDQAPGEYGFYANVNPGVDHPRWSQASERIIGGGLFSKRRDTELFNG
ncbi:MAG: protein-methionine-sulfoxide reductase catalytic subunit MsrP, partial [Pseudomonadota bacterium]